MSPLAPFPCAKTDAVLALHLDGDLEAGGGDHHGYAFADSESLHAHLRECASCQTTLRRARRLDAALANAAGAALAAHERRPGSSWPELQQRWFGALTAPVAPTTTQARVPERPRARAARRAAVAAAAAITLGITLGIGIAIGCPSPHRPIQARDEVPAPVVATAGEAPAAARPAIAGPLLPAPDALRHGHARQATAAARTVDQTPLVPVDRLAGCVADAGKPPVDRLAATAALLAACRSCAPDPQAAFRSLLTALAGCGEFGTAPALHERQLELVREAAPAQGHLATWLVELDAPGKALTRDDLAALVVGTRLGSPAVDGLLRRAVRRHPETAEIVAAALRCGARAQGGGRLLLDIWQDLALRGLLPGDSAEARGWFRAQPAALFGEVAAELRRSHAADQRLHCLLALGAADDGSTVPPLLAHVASRHLDEAHAAAFALSCLPRNALAPLVTAAAADEAFLLRAALARAGHAAAAPWIEALALRPAERQRLHESTLLEFPEVASWFRERGPASD